MTKKKVQKNQYGEFGNVLLSDEELEKLKQRLPSSYNSYIEKVDGYIESKGKNPYASHYATILNWARRDGETMSQKQQLQDRAMNKKQEQGRISRKPSYNLEQIKRDAMMNTTIKF